MDRWTKSVREGLFSIRRCFDSADLIALPEKQMAVIYQQYSLVTNKMKNLLNQSYYNGRPDLAKVSTNRFNHYRTMDLSKVDQINEFVDPT